MQFLWKWLEDFVGKGLDWTIIVEILFYASASLVPMALPLGVLLASVMTFGNLGENYELTALKSSGISLLKVMRSLIILTILISISAFFFSNNALPYTNLKMARVLYDVTRKRPELNIKTGVFNNSIEGYSIKINSKKNSGGMMYDFMIYNHTNNRGNPEVTLADSGEMNITNDRKNMIISLYSGQTFTEMKERPKVRKKQYPYRHDKFKQQTMVFKLHGFEYKKSDESIFKSNYQMMSLEQLSFTIDTLKMKHSQKRDKLEKKLIKYNYLKFEKDKFLIKDTIEIIKDSLSRYATSDNLSPGLNFDSLYSSMSEPIKSKALKSALTNAKNTFASIDNDNKVIHDNTKWLRKHQIEWYRKFSLSFACIIFFFIGAPLGAIIRKGGFGLPILVSVILFMFYYIISITGEKFAREDVLPVFIGSWLSSAILFPFGVFITYKASRDSVLFSVERYFNVAKAILKFLKINKNNPTINK